MADVTASMRIASMVGQSTMTWADIVEQEEEEAVLAEAAMGTVDQGRAITYADMLRERDDATDYVPSELFEYSGMPQRIALGNARRMSAQAAPFGGVGTMREGTVLTNGKVNREFLMEHYDHVLPLAHGIPYGPMVTPLCWTDADLNVQLGADAGDELRELFSQRWDGELEINDATVAVHWDQLEVGTRQNEYCFMGCTIMVGDSTHLRAIVTLTHEGMQFRGIHALHISAQALGRAGPDWLALNAVLASVHLIILDGVWSPETLTNLHDGSVSQLKRVTIRQQGTALRRHVATVAPAHVFAQSSAADIGLTTPVDVSFLTANGTIGYGRVPACDVPPSPVVVLSGNGGLQQSGSVLIIAGREGVYLHTTTLSRNAVYEAFKTNPKLAPTVRDSAQSHILAASLRLKHGHATIRDGEGATIAGVATFLTSPEPEFILTADPAAVAAGIGELCELSHYTLRWCRNTVTCTHNVTGKVVTRTIVYDPSDATPRWWPLIARELRPTTSFTSEEVMDYGASGVARFLARGVMQYGIILPGLMLNGRSRHFHAAKSRADLAAVGADTELRRRNYILDMEYMTRVTGTGTAKIVERYVYALGLVEVADGTVLGAVSIVDNTAAVDKFIQDNPQAATRETANHAALLEQPNIVKGDPLPWLEAIQKMARHSTVRLFGKGVGNDREVLSGELNGATRLFVRQAEVEPLITEFGSLMHKYEALVDDPNAPHDPGAEALEFAAAAGFVPRQTRLAPKLTLASLRYRR